MELKLSNYIKGSIKVLPLEEAMKLTKKIIRDLEKLYDIEHLSKDKLKKIIKKYYEFNLINKPEDLIVLSKSILKTNDIKERNISTIILVPPKYYKKRIDVSIIYDGKEKLKDSYTTLEIKELVNTRKIIIKSIDYKSIKIESEYFHLLNIPLLPISDINERNMDTYEDIILKIARKKLQKSKVHRDIMRIINIMRTRNYKEGFKYFKNLYTLDTFNKGIIRRKVPKKFDK